MNILFVCTGNTCRSPMAAALFNKLAVEKGLDVRIESAGIFADAGAPASVGARHAMEKYGIDLSYHKAQNINSELLEKSDVILTMTKAHKAQLLAYVPDKVYTLLEYAEIFGDIADPFGADDEIYEVCAAEILQALLKVAEKIGNS